MHIYFSGIGGFGIGPLALLARDAGYVVSGSDKEESAMSALLTEKSIQIHTGPQDGSAIAEVHRQRAIDWFVYSSGLPADHPELQFAKENGIKTSKRDELLNHILSEKNLKMIAVAGTHGKTTTTGMLIWAFGHLSIPVSYSVGTLLSYGSPAQYLNDSQYFIYECDEFDRNFLNYQPELSIITAVDYDHADTYPTTEDYKAAFGQFIQQSKHTFLWQTANEYLGLAPGQDIKVFNDDSSLAELNLAGQHNRQNAYLVVETIAELYPDIERSAIEAAVNSFPGTARRFEKLADNLYSDYAHHPTEIAATIAMAKEVNPNIVVVYQPHQNIRQHELKKEGLYKNCFFGAKQVYWLPTYLSREDPSLEVLTPENLMQGIETPHQTVRMNDDLKSKISDHLQQGDLVLALSAGDLDSWLRTTVINR